MNTRDLTIKFTSFVRYIESREWAKEGLMLPRLFCVVPDIAQERRMQPVAQVRLAPIPGIVMWMTTEVLLNELGPLAPIWSWGKFTRGQLTWQNGSIRQCPFDIIPGKEGARNLIQGK